MSAHDQGSGYERVGSDFYVEPAWAVEALFNAERFAGSVYDPAVGTGTIVEVARKRGFTSFGTDIHDRRGVLDFRKLDFLNGAGCPQSSDNVICNPPYADAEKFVRVALNVARHKVAFLLRLPFLESARRAKLFEETPLARVLVFANRVPIAPGNGAKLTGNSSKTAYAWFIWSHDHQGPPTLGWLRKPETTA